jgi:uncharacterized phage infection (PIP) family protein YhgE
MNPRRTRIAGIVLICTAGLGVILSLGGLILLAVYHHNISTRVAAGLSDLNSALTITQDGLGAARNALISADAALDTRISTLEAVSAALKGMDPTLQALGSLVGTDLPDTLQATQDALESAQTSAKNVDRP